MLMKIENYAQFGECILVARFHILLMNSLRVKVVLLIRVKIYMTSKVWNSDMCL